MKIEDECSAPQIAAQSIEFRGAAWTELARTALTAGNLSGAAQYATKALGVDAGNLDALGIGIVAARRRGDAATRDRLLAQFDSVGLRYGTGAEVLRDLDFRLTGGGFLSPAKDWP